MMERVEMAGGLRKELTPEICVQMHIIHTNPDANILEAIEIASRVKYLCKEMNNIPW